MNMLQFLLCMCIFPYTYMLFDMLTHQSGTNRHEVKTFNVDGTYLSTFEPYSSFLHHTRSAPISCTAFHPHRTLLACAALNDNHINLVAC